MPIIIHLRLFTLDTANTEFRDIIICPLNRTIIEFNAITKNMIVDEGLTVYRIIRGINF